MVFCSKTSTQGLAATRPTSQWVLECIKNRLKRPGRGADNFNAEVKIYVHFSVCLEVLLLI